MADCPQACPGTCGSLGNSWAGRAGRRAARPPPSPSTGRASGVSWDGDDTSMRTHYYCAGKASPAARVREVFIKPECRRKALLAAFTLSSVHCKMTSLVLTLPGQSGEYDADPVERKICLE